MDIKINGTKKKKNTRSRVKKIVTQDGVTIQV